MRAVVITSVGTPNRYGWVNEGVKVTLGVVELPDGTEIKSDHSVSVGVDAGSILKALLKEARGG